MVLDQLDSFLEDQHLHIIAPPGSGKTVLGLEVIVRLNRASLILAPTLTIRDQWISRLCELFLDTNKIPDWISTDIRNPRFLTVITYQGLHAACKDRDSKNEIIAKLKQQNINTFALDEAHHLKNQWWMTLNDIKKAISPTIIGLTATPPYDSSYTEWQRYLELNGEVDMEISIPELIKEGDLCPHQDHVYFSQPTPEELKYISRFRENIDLVYNEYSKSDILINSFMQTDLWLNPNNNLEWLYENLPIYTSYLILLGYNNIEIPDVHWKVLGIDEKEREKHKPEFLYQRLEIILNFFLFQDKIYFTYYEEQKESIINKLRHKGAIERNIVSLTYNTSINRLITSSRGKFRSIIDIARFEHTELKDQLRMVILSDFIRDEYLAFSQEERKEIKKMGVIPIFEKLIENDIPTDKIGVLTGSLVILPKTALTKFQSLCERRGINNLNNYYKDYREKHILLSNNNAISESIVELTTILFSEGEIEILIGTKSLLGEGWDAPAINSLILASFVGSFVLSNQMRGRAIRTQRDNPSKTSNIWHLVCTDPTALSGGQDLETLQRRFKSFVGISNTEDVYIENGIDRLNIKKEKYTPDNIQELNNNTLCVAKDRDNLERKWQKAIERGTRIIDEIKIPYPKKEKPYQTIKKRYFTKTIGYLIADLVLALMIFAGDTFDFLFRNLRAIRSFKDLLYYIGYIAIIGLILLGRQTYKTLKLYIQYRDISLDLENIGKALLESLIKQGAIKSSISGLQVKAETHEDGAVSCYLTGATNGEQTIFLDALHEIVNTIENPRYIIIRKSNRKVFGKDDYHAVPTLLGINKNLASYFHLTWCNIVGRAKLVYTRTLEGRKFLLKARIQSLSAKIEDNQVPERYRKWD